MRWCIPLIYQRGISQGVRERKIGGKGVDGQVLSFAPMRERTTRRITLTTQTLIKSLLVVGFYSWYIKGGAEERKEISHTK